MTRSVRLDEMADAMTSRGAPLQLESALFMVLQALDAMRAGALMLRADEVAIDEEGTVRLAPRAPRADDEAASNEALVSLLEAVLMPVPTSVVELSIKVRGAELTTRAAMTSELQAMLVPFNRSAAQRMLGRMVREHLRWQLARAPTDRAGTVPEDRDGEVALLLGDDAPRGAPSVGETWIDDNPLGAGAGARAKADDTEPDAPAGDEWSEKRPRKTSSQTAGALMLLFSLAALASGAWFLWTRVRGG